MEQFKNLTAKQIETILDDLLYKSFYPIVTKTNWLKHYDTGLLSWVFNNNRSKISSIDHDEQINHLYNLNITNDAIIKFEYYTRCKLDRNITLFIIKEFLAYVVNYKMLYQEWLTNKSEVTFKQLKTIEEHLGANHDNLYAIITNVISWRDETLSYRNKLIERYLGLCFQQAILITKSSNHNIDTNDLVQNYAKAIIKALNKFNHQKGALTSYIKLWMRHVSQFNSDHLYGMAYEIPHAHRAKIAKDKSNKDCNFYISLSSKLLESVLMCKQTDVIVQSEQEYNNLLSLMQKVDPKGVCRLFLDVEEPITKEHVLLMKQQMQQENIAF